MVLILAFGSAQAQESDSFYIDLSIPTADQETDYMWRTIRDISFFDEFGYSLSLPEGEIIESLKKKSRENTLSDDDYRELLLFMKKKVYKKSDYDEGYKKVSTAIPLLESFLEEIKNTERNWDFKLFETYRVVLTLYGPGGSYNPDDGSILLYTTKNGDFKQYKNPANTIIHEITHIGMEESIILRYQLPHGVKERIVDTFVSLNFQSQLPDYRIQNMGNTEIDSLFSTKEDLYNLEEVIQSFLKKN